MKVAQLKQRNKVGKIFFVTGRSCAGKSSLLSALKSQISGGEIVLHDIDEDGVPSDGRQHWRPFRVEQLFAQALKRAGRGMSTIIFGISFPHEVIDSVRYNQEIPLHFVLLEVSQRDFDRRMKSRLKIQKQTSMWPAIRQPNQKLAQTLHNQIVNQKNAIIVNSSSSSRQRMAKVVSEFVKSKIGML